MRWVSEITHVNAPYFFVDSQRYGPYKLWHHQHRFKKKDSGVEIEDIVDYILPFSLFGILINRLIVARQLQQIFDYRSQALASHFSRS